MPILIRGYRLLLRPLECRASDCAPDQLTYEGLARRSNAFARGLSSLGVTAGDRVALMLPQGFETVIAHVAIYKLGAIAVPPSRDTRPCVGRKPKTPQYAAGTRTDPPVSDPTAKSASPAATAAAEPDDDPPGSRPGAWVL